MTAEILVLRLIHVLGGIYWVGSALFSAIFLMPALTRAGPAAGQVMANLQARRLFIVMPIVALLTILSGFRLMWIFSAGFAAAYFATLTGQILAVSGGLALATFALGILIARPAAARSGELRARVAGETDPEARATIQSELGSLQRRMALVGAVSTVLLVLAAAGMAVARYAY